MTKKFPKTIFVKWEQPSRDEAYLAAGEDMYGIRLKPADTPAVRALGDK